MKSSRAVTTPWRYLGLAALMSVFVFPLWWMLSYSLRPVGLPAPTRLELIALPLTLDNYARVSQYISLGRFFGNSLAVAGLAVPLTVVTASWAGLALAHAARAEQATLITLSVAALLMPASALWMPRFILFSHLGWLDSFVPLVLPALMGTSPFYVLLFYFAFARVPLEFYESAQLDGANPFQVWYWLALPLARPAVIAVAMLSFAFYWSNYADPLLYLQTEAHYTLPIGMKLLEMARPSDFPVLMAASAIVIAPVVFLFAFAQRFFLQGQISLERWLN
ncbi:MAG: carbohydrate ABC transporter permease [Chloroflexi bacterium]|nr:carbohydrate ABC transporter permease [Chloroflexota bacterium]